VPLTPPRRGILCGKLIIFKNDNYGAREKSPLGRGFRGGL